MAGTWLGDRTATAPLYAVTLGGGALGFALANLRRARADAAMAMATLGLLVAATGAWIPGLALLGVGAGAAYLDLQTRLQHAATNPSEFARAFAILKGASAAAVLGAPALVGLAGPRGVLLGGACSAIAGAALAAPAPGRMARRGVRGVLRFVAGRVLAVEVEAHAPRVDGPAVVVSNHPHWLDGVVALLADDDLRPVARRQRHLGARMGIWAADAVVTTRPADPTAADPSTPGAPPSPRRPRTCDRAVGSGWRPRAGRTPAPSCVRRGRGPCAWPTSPGRRSSRWPSTGWTTGPDRRCDGGAPGPDAGSGSPGGPP